MSSNLRDLRLKFSIPSQDMVDVVRAIYPKYDKPLQSKCEAPEVYGIELRRDARKALFQKYDPEGWEKHKRHTDGHRFKNRVQCRLDDETYRHFVAKYRADGFKTAQDCLVDLIRAYTVQSDWDA